MDHDTTPPTLLTVEVRAGASASTDIDDPAWQLEFEFWAPGGLRSRFIVEEPDSLTLDRWRAIANGAADRTELYGGNGEGSIRLVGSAQPDLLFTASPSGGGGDVTAQIKVPLAAVGPALHAALDDAVARGFGFLAKRLP